MKMRMLTAASIILTVVLVAAMSQAAPSCCDPKNSSIPAASLAPVQPMNGPAVVAAPRARVVSRQIVSGPVRSTPKYPARPMPPRQYAVAKPIGFPNAPAVPSCCAVPNGNGQARGINAAVQGQFRGCGCCGGNANQARNSGFQPVNGQVQFMSNPPTTGRQVYPVGQASCCSAAGSGGNKQGSRWNVSAQPAVFPGLW
jgi:hypothetical protein